MSGMKWNLDFEKTLLELEHRMIILIDDWHETACGMGGKPHEPSISIELGNDLKWSAEIYAYTLNFKDGTRHHFFEGESLTGLLKEIEAAIDTEEQVLETWKKENPNFKATEGL